MPPNRLRKCRRIEEWLEHSINRVRGEHHKDRIMNLPALVTDLSLESINRALVALPMPFPPAQVGQRFFLHFYLVYSEQPNTTSRADMP